MTRAPASRACAMIAARSARIAFVLSITNDVPSDRAAAIISRCRAGLLRTLGIRSFEMCRCVAAKRSRYSVVLPEAGSPMRMMHSGVAGDVMGHVGRFEVRDLVRRQRHR